MIILLHGADTFRSGIKLKELEGAYQQKHKGGFSFEKLYGPDVDIKQAKSALQSGSLFDTSKLVVLEGLAENNTLKKEIADWPELKNIQGDKNNLLILSESSSVSSDKEYKKIISIADKKQEFKKLSTSEMVKWFSAYYAERGSVPREVIQEVVVLCGEDMWQAYNELNKIRAYSYGRKITKEALGVMAVGDAEAQIFPTIDAIFEGNSDKAFYNLLLQWRAGEAPEYIFYMIARQLKLLAEIKEQKESGVAADLIAKKIGQHPFVVKKTLKLAERFSWPKLKELYSRVESLDIKAKTGQLNPYLSCELLSAAITS